MRVIVFSGKGGAGVSTLAAATAVASARAGRRTLAFGLGAGLGHALGQRLAARPEAVADRLDAAEAHGRRADGDEFRDWMQQLLDWRGLETELAHDLAGLPGMNHVGRLLDLERQVSSGNYEVLVVDGAPLAQALDVPPSLDAAARWLERLFAPRQSTVFEPFLRVFAGDYATAGDEVLERGRELLGRLAALRSIVTDRDATSVRLVMPADAGSLETVRQAAATLTLFEWPVDAVFVNRLLPEASGHALARMRDEQQEALKRAREALSPLPVLEIGIRSPAPHGLEELAGLALEAYGGADALSVLYRGPRHSFEHRNGHYRMNLALPGADRDNLSLEQTDEAMVVHLDGRRRVLPLPPEVRYYEGASWTYADGVLTVIFER